jgi:hypothetical protein
MTVPAGGESMSHKDQAAAGREPPGLYPGFSQFSGGGTQGSNPVPSSVNAESVDNKSSLLGLCFELPLCTHVQTEELPAGRHTTGVVWIVGPTDQHLLP